MINSKNKKSGKLKFKKTILLATIATSMLLTACSSSSSTVDMGGDVDIDFDSDSNSYDSKDDIAITGGIGLNKADNIKENSMDDIDSNESDNEGDNENTSEDTSEDTSDDSENNDDNEEVTPEEIDNNIVLSEEKIVYTCDTTLETLDFDDTYKKLQSLMDKYSCVIESETMNDDGSSYLYNNYAHYGEEPDEYTTGKIDNIKVRVPSKDFKKFISEYSNLGNVTSKTQTADNITQHYYDTTAEVEGKKAELQRLQDMLATATDINNIISINSKITEVQTEINKLTTEIRTMDTEVAYSTVNIEVKEVVQYTEKENPEKTNTFLDRVKKSFKDGWKGVGKFLENFLLALIELLFVLIKLVPVAIVIGLIVVIIRLTCWKKIKTKFKKKTTYDGSINSMLSYDGTQTITNSAVEQNEATPETTETTAEVTTESEAGATTEVTTEATEARTETGELNDEK